MDWSTYFAGRLPVFADKEGISDDCAGALVKALRARNDLSQVSCPNCFVPTEFIRPDCPSIEGARRFFSALHELGYRPLVNMVSHVNVGAVVTGRDNAIVMEQLLPALLEVTHLVERYGNDISQWPPANKDPLLSRMTSRRPLQVLLHIAAAPVLEGVAQAKRYLRDSLSDELMQQLVDDFGMHVVRAGLATRQQVFDDPTTGILLGAAMSGEVRLYARRDDLYEVDPTVLQAKVDYFDPWASMKYNQLKLVAMLHGSPEVEMQDAPLFVDKSMLGKLTEAPDAAIRMVALQLVEEEKQRNNPRGAKGRVKKKLQQTFKTAQPSQIARLVDPLCPPEWSRGGRPKK